MQSEVSIPITSFRMALWSYNTSVPSFRLFMEMVRASGSPPRSLGCTQHMISMAWRVSSSPAEGKPHFVCVLDVMLFLTRGVASACGDFVLKPGELSVSESEEITITSGERGPSNLSSSSLSRRRRSSRCAGDKLEQAFCGGTAGPFERISTLKEGLIFEVPTLDVVRPMEGPLNDELWLMKFVANPGELVGGSEGVPGWSNELLSLRIQTDELSRTIRPTRSSMSCRICSGRIPHVM